MVNNTQIGIKTIVEGNMSLFACISSRIVTQRRMSMIKDYNEKMVDTLNDIIDRVNVLERTMSKMIKAIIGLLDEINEVENDTDEDE